MSRRKLPWRQRWRLKRMRSPTLYNGIRVPLDRRLMTQEILLHLLLRTYEQPEVLAVQALVRPGDRVLELGTGLGIVSSIVARLADGGTVLSYEANAALAPYMHELHRLNGITNVTLRQGILRAEPTTATERFHLHTNFMGSSLIATYQRGETIDVPVSALAPVLAEFRPTVLLCDIEGGEAELLSHSRLPGVRVVIVEIHAQVLSRDDIVQIFANLLEQGFCPILEHTRNEVVAFERAVENA